MRSCVNAGRGLAAAAVVLGVVSAAPAQPALDPAAECSAALRQRFAPADPDAAGTYIVCRSSKSIRELTDPQWPIVEAGPDEAFAGAAPGVRRRLALLYHGRRLEVGRGWRATAHLVESVTLIAPPPDDSLTGLLPGTLIVLVRVPH